MEKPRPGTLDAQVEVSRYVADIAARLHGRLADVTSEIHAALKDQIADLRRDPRIMELLWASIEGNVDTMLHAMRYDIAVERVEAPTAALEYARRLAQHGVPVNALVRAYRLGQRRMTELIFAELRAIDIPDAMRVAVIEAMGTAIFAYIDWMSQQVVVIYEDERERWLENQNTLRGVRVREILAATKSIDVDAATTSIRYPLRWHHVGLVMWYPDQGAEVDELPRLQRFLRELGEAAGVDASPLFVAADRSSGWGWLPYRATADDAVATIRRFAQTEKDSPSVAIGTMGAGVDGFRHSHRQAAEARAVAIVTEQPNSSTRTVIAASDPGLSVVARLGGDVDGIREWVADVLGDLAADTDNDARLRDTLRVYLGCGCSYKLAAEELNMHFNSVKYRVGRAVARRGREIGTDRLEVELALLACHWYGAAVPRTK
ncbi:PucR family transcriptional regulator [Mycobacterium sp. 852002-51163_SCH5372311]|uniref:PucR family transcriptional regulator n=1 Tax=Mycobacterium sp. 852002-51163_SCH5372311 TaxID=1834097 RepID=UPI0007FC90FF|nr:helix-turn-helix domain-containing protein [Mycobacterium sp. 852002-51163_SCH5372311]OBF84459.1 PucR family transcriptional regulator [Mycobacterium sp. 852002-51163_SCH5372311]